MLKVAHFLWERNVVPFSSDIGLSLLHSPGSSLMYFVFHDAANVFSWGKVWTAGV